MVLVHKPALNFMSSAGNQWYKWAFLWEPVLLSAECNFPAFSLPQQPRIPPCSWGYRISVGISVCHKSGEARMSPSSISETLAWIQTSGLLLVVITMLHIRLVGTLPSRTATCVKRFYRMARKLFPSDTRRTISAPMPTGVCFLWGNRLRWEVEDFLCCE